MGAKQVLGQAGERLAAHALEEHGYRILDRNWRGTRGELDLVAVQGDTLVAIEVKTRSTLRFGHPAEAVTARKLAQVRRLIGQWLVEHANDFDQWLPVRVDVVAITLNATDPNLAAAPIGVGNPEERTPQPETGVPAIEILRGVVA